MVCISFHQLIISIFNISISVDNVIGAQVVSATALDVTLRDINGNEIPLQGTVELCFSVETEDSTDVCFKNNNNNNNNENSRWLSKLISFFTMFQDACLGFVNEETNEWECADECVEENDEGQFCGETDHFTSFAILLSGGGSNGCDSEDGVDKVITYLSVGFVAVAAIFLFIFLLIAEIVFRIRKDRNEKFLERTIYRRTQLADSGGPSKHNTSIK